MVYLFHRHCARLHRPHLCLAENHNPLPDIDGWLAFFMSNVASSRNQSDYCQFIIVKVSYPALHHLPHPQSSAIAWKCSARELRTVHRKISWAYGGMLPHRAACAIAPMS